MAAVGDFGAAHWEVLGSWSPCAEEGFRAKLGCHQSAAVAKASAPAPARFG